MLFHVHPCLALAWGTIGTAGLIMAALGLFFGFLLAVAARVFHVETDPRVEEIRQVLPGANCGACGHVGCDAYAQAVAEGKAPCDACIPGGSSVASEVASIMGLEEEGEKERYIAVVHCNGDCHETLEKYHYIGIKTCLAAASLFNGNKSCDYGCLGHGDCMRACPFDAISIVRGIAYIDPIACKGCKTCVAVCPKQLIYMQPASKRYSVRCRNPRPGGELRDVCNVACIGCRKCEKVCPKKTIFMQESVAVIDPFNCVNCGLCAKNCPTAAIKEQKELRPVRPPRRNPAAIKPQA